MQSVLKFMCLACVALMFSSSAQAGLVGHYTFEDAKNLFDDSSLLGNDGSTLAGSPSQGATAIAGAGALLLDGSSAGEINAVADDVPTGSHTISAWINTTDPDRPTFVAANTPSGGNSNMLFLETGSNVGVQVFDNTTFVANSSSPVTNDGEYHHVAWVRDGSDGFLYVDGILRDTAGSLAYTRTAGDLWSIGQEFDGGTPSDFFAGLIDDVQIYDMALNANQISRVFNNPGLTGIVPEPTTAALGLLGFAGMALRRRRSA